MRPAFFTALVLSLVSVATLTSVQAHGAAVDGRADERPVVVLDPGHGGSNTGAFGPQLGRHEKHLTLAIARATAAQLKRLAPTARVVLTRWHDRYLTLEQRVRHANQAGGQLFVSIHLNASEAHLQQGYETYVLSKKASDEEALLLAYRENGRGQANAPAGLAGEVAAILADVRRQGLHGQSLRFARTVQRALARVRTNWSNRGVRHAPFDVLMGLRMPGVLVEVGFIDHPAEGTEWGARSVQSEVAGALAQAIADHLGTRKQPPANRRSRRPVVSRR